MTDAPLPVTNADIEVAAKRLAGMVGRTPVLTSRTLDERLGASLFLKAEHLQRVGAFKIRGAVNALTAIDRSVRARGAVAFSSGNHAQAVACACRIMGVPATIVMPTDAPPVKLAATRAYGAEVVTYDRYTDDRAAIAREIATHRGATLIPPFDHADVIAGQGTAARELFADVPDLDLLVVPVGGGGLLAGSAVAAVAAVPDVTIVGVEPGGRRAARDAVEQGRIVEVAVPRTVLDGQQTTHIGHLALPILQAHVSSIVGVDDAVVLRTVRTLAVRMKQVVEPSGACGLAAILDGRIDVAGRRVGVLLSGGNIAPDVLAAALTDSDGLAW